MKHAWSLMLSCFFFYFGTAQQQEDILLTINGTPVFSNEFIRIYKKNLDLIQDESQKDIDNYLQTFINFKLKIEAAKEDNYHKKVAYIKELEGYKKELTKNYLIDTKTSEKLMLEAYERLKNEVNADHILVRLEESASPEDSLIAFKKINKLRESAIKEGFNVVMKKVHNGKDVFGEQLGYFSVFRMDYTFESAAYKTKEGEISQSFRTPFGYHILKVNDIRSNRGEVEVAHIMTKDNQGAAIPSISAKERIEDIYVKVSSGNHFEEMARQFSDDRSSAAKGGRLSKFGSDGLNSSTFKNVSFSLNEGEISKPFQSKYGWHILKVLKKHSVGTLEEERINLENSIKRDSRSKILTLSFLENLKKEYNFEEIQTDKSYLFNVIANRGVDNDLLDKVLFKLNGINFDSSAFVEFFNAKNRNTTAVAENRLPELYNEYVQYVVLKYHEDNLERVNEEYAAIVSEYRDGLLLFDYTQNKIWNKARKDSVAIRSYYEKNKSEYSWNKRVNVLIASVPDKKNIKRVRKLIKQKSLVQDIKRAVKDAELSEVVFSEHILEIGDERLPENYKAASGTSTIYETGSGYVIVKTAEVMQEEQKTFEEAKIQVMNDYEEFLEREWLEDLHASYDVKVNNETFNKIKKEFTK